MILDVVVEADLSGFRALTVAVAEFERRWQEEVQRQLLFIQGAWTAAVTGALMPGMVRPVNSPEYAASIGDAASLEYPFNGDPFSGRVIATDTRVVARIERGYASFDLKQGLLSGVAAKHGAHGQKYVTVPLTHTTPGSTGQKGPPMPAEIYNQVRRLAPGQALTGLGDYGLRSKIAAGVNAEAIRRQQPAPMLGNYTWRTSPYEGMTRTGRAGHGGYTTFRRVSEQWTDAKGQRHGTSLSAWIHPGMPANPVVAAVRQYVEPIIQEAFAALIREMTGGTAGAGEASG